MFDFGNANEAQTEAIKTTKTPLLIIACPGTGKTFTLIQRAIYLIQEKGVKPKSIIIATFDIDPHYGLLQVTESSPKYEKKKE